MKKFICFDVGGTNIKMALLVGNKIQQKIIQLPTKKNQIAKNIVDLTRQQLNDKTQYSGICLAWPQPINISLKAEIIKTTLTKIFQLPVFIENDANVFTLYEAILGQGKKYKTVVGITLGTGVGSGLVIDKKIYHGRKSAIELGHTTLNFLGPSCNCGQKGCWEQYAGSAALLRLAKNYKLKITSGKELYNLAKLKNGLALKVWKDYGKFVGLGIVNAINAYDPEIIIVGGNISRANKFFKNSMFTVIKQKSFLPVPIIKFSKNYQAGLIGARLIAKAN